jgi:transcriptional regulator GlxA family with amidase domain
MHTRRKTSVETSGGSGHSGEAPASAGVSSARSARRAGARVDAAQLSHRAVERAAEFLRSHAAEGVRIGDLARVAGISERALRNAFRREHGLSPKQFDMRERLESVRRALCGMPANRSITTVATEFGFFELGRFSRIYKQAFGETPSQTIRTSAAIRRPS